MFASTAEYYRTHPNGNDSEGNRSNDYESDADEKTERVSRTLEGRRILRLSGAMLLEDALEHLLHALDNPYTVELEFADLGLDGLLEDHEDLDSNTLARLLRSREWKSIHLWNCRRIGLLFDLTKNVQIQSLTVALSPKSKLETVVRLAQAIINNQIQKLSLTQALPRYNRPSGMSDLAPAFCSLKELELSIHPNDVPVFCNAIRASAPASFQLERLDISLSILTDQDVANIVQAIIRDGPTRSTIQTLECRGLSPCKSHTLAALTLSLSDNSLEQSSCPLRHLHLSNRQGDAEDRTLGLLEFFQALSHPHSPVSNLQTLELKYYCIHDDEMEALVNSLVITNNTDGSRANHPCRLETLQLFACNMTSRGMERLAREALPQMQNLRRLAVYGALSSYLLAILPRVTSLQVLDVNDRTPEHEYWLNLNRSGRRLLGSTVHVPAGVWPLVLFRAQVISYYETTDEKTPPTPALEVSSNGGQDPILNGLWYLLRYKVLLEL